MDIDALGICFRNVNGEQRTSLCVLQESLMAVSIQRVEMEIECAIGEMETDKAGA